MNWGEHPERLLPHHVRDVLGEDAKFDAPIAAGSETVEFSVIGDPQDAPIHLLLAAPTQSGPRFLVVGNRIEKHALSLLNEADRHGTRPWSLKRRLVRD